MVGVLLCSPCSVKDPAKSLPFYQGLLGLVQLCKRDFSDFSLIFLACPDSLPAGFVPAVDDDAAMESTKTIPGAVVELTQYGTVIGCALCVLWVLGYFDIARCVCACSVLACVCVPLRCCVWVSVSVRV